MLKKAAIVIVVCLLTGSAVYGYLYYAGKRKFADDRSVLVLRIRTLDETAARDIAYEWKHVAKDYLDDYRQGRLDEKFRRAAEEDHPAYAVAAYECRKLIRASIARGEGRATEAMIEAELQNDARVAHLERLWSAHSEIYQLVRKAQVATTSERLEKVRRQFEERQAALAKLFKVKVQPPAKKVSPSA